MGTYFSWQCTGRGQYSVLSGDLLFLAVYWLGAVHCTGWGPTFLGSVLVGAVQCTGWGPTFLGSVLGGGQYSGLSGDLLFLAVYWLGAVQCTEWGPTFLGSIVLQAHYCLCPWV